MDRPAETEEGSDKAHIVDGVDNDDNEMVSSIHMQEAARSNKLYCAMTTLGHCTKAFGTVRQLARLIRSTYGSN